MIKSSTFAEKHKPVRDMDPSEQEAMQRHYEELLAELRARIVTIIGLRGYTVDNIYDASNRYYVIPEALASAVRLAASLIDERRDYATRLIGLLPMNEDDYAEITTQLILRLTPIRTPDDMLTLTIVASVLAHIGWQVNESKR